MTHSKVLPFCETRKVLIIDDEDDIREVTAAALEIVAGWQVIQAGSGLDGIACAQREVPNAILLDVQMPEMSGPDTLAQLRRVPELSAIPVIFLTARVQAAEQERLREIGAVAVLPKPFDPLTLAEDLASILGWK